MTTTVRTATRTAALAFAVGIAFTSVAPAFANDADVIKRGGCSGSSNWKLKAKPDNGRLEVEGEVDSNRTGQNWKWKILHDGDVSYRGTATTTGRSGSFSVERRVVDSPGKDQIGWRATNPATGEYCRGSLSI